jgi:DNA-binding protein H-NS
LCVRWRRQCGAEQDHRKKPFHWKFSLSLGRLIGHRSAPCLTVIC